MNNEIIIANVDKRLLEKNIKRIGEFKGYRNRLLVRCLIDGYEWEVFICNIFYNNAGCPKCSNNARITNESIDTYISNNNKKIRRIDNVKTCKTKIEFECLIDGYRWVTTPSKILNMHHGCPKCGGSLPLTNEVIDEKLLSQHREIKRIGNFTNNTKTKIEWECLTCNHCWFAMPGNVLNANKTGCPECKRKIVLCNQSKKLNNEKIDERIKDRNIKRIGDYFDSKDKPIEWECLIDKHRWFTSPGNILNNKSGCPICKNKNEKAIHKLILESVKNYTYFKHHKTFLFNNRKYIVDFYIEINNKKYIVEYNGGQHYFSVKLYGGDKAFIKQQKRDQELRDYCKKNDIMLIEIPYYFTKEQRMDEISKIV